MKPFFMLADKMERSFKKMIKNYLPNIQVIIPSSKKSKYSENTPNTPGISGSQQGGHQNKSQSSRNLAM